jgi:hypothetical protein
MPPGRVQITDYARPVFRWMCAGLGVLWGIRHPCGEAVGVRHGRATPANRDWRRMDGLIADAPLMRSADVVDSAGGGG